MCPYVFQNILMLWRLLAVASVLVWVVSVYFLHQVASASLCVPSQTMSSIALPQEYARIATTVSHNFTVSPPSESSVNCPPKSKIFFLRVHKTGTSTITTLLYRFALSHGLSIFPAQDHPWPNKTLDDVIMLPPGCKKKHGGPFDVFAEHYNFNISQVDRYFPETDYDFVVSLRHPYPQLRSLFGEFQLPFRLGLPANNPGVDPVVRFLDGIDIYGQNARIPAKSQSARQLGVPEHLLDDKDYIFNWIKGMGSRFANVIITEYFDESMLLLRRRLCWSMQDIIYLVQRRNNALAFRHHELNRTQEAIHRNWSYADYTIYKHFSQKLFENLANEEDFLTNL